MGKRNEKSKTGHPVFVVFWLASEDLRGDANNWPGEQLDDDTLEIAYRWRYCFNKYQDEKISVKTTPIFVR